MSIEICTTDKPKTLRIGLIGPNWRDPVILKKFNSEAYNNAITKFNDYLNDYLKTTNLDKSNIILISNGSPWIDYITMQLYMDGGYAGIELYIPSDFNVKAHKFTNTHEGRTLNQIHEQFSKIMGFDSLNVIEHIYSSKIKKMIKRGYTQCSTLMNNNCDIFIEFKLDDFV